MKHIILFLMTLQGISAAAQSQLDAYISQALNSNETIKQQQFLLTKSLYTLKEAKSLFLPTVTAHGSYTIAEGGRTIDVPVGDLLNPVYKTLNQLTGGDKFPQLENRKEQLNPNNFYDVKIRTTYPILNSEIQYNRKIKAQQYDLQKIEIDLYKRELVKEVKIAYYKYLQASEAAGIYESAILLVKENLRVNTSLFNNQKINRTAVIRSDNEVTRYNASLETALQTQNTAKAYFNFLLNTDLDKQIFIDSMSALPADLLLNDSSVARREELTKLRQAVDINRNIIGLAKSYQRPKLNAFADLGTQGNATKSIFFSLKNLLPWKFTYSTWVRSNTVIVL